MITTIKDLVDICTSELQIREYREEYAANICSHWDSLIQWMDQNHYSEFTEDIGLLYCDETVGTHLTGKELPGKSKLALRAIYMLISYQKDGEFSFRSPSVEKRFEGVHGELMESYIHYMENSLHLSYKTIDNKKLYLHMFCVYLNAFGIDLKDINLNTFTEFYDYHHFSESGKHNCIHTLRGYFHFLYEFEKTEFDYAVYVLSDNYKRHKILPTTYTAEEIKRIIESVERTSAIGKRDYLVLLLAAEYGFRAGDIIKLRFENIDWDKNVISIIQDKTGVPVNYPLIASVGNAIIDYVKNGRPETSEAVIIVSHQHSDKGTSLSSPTVHSIVSKYIRKAGIKDWQNKKHGPHSLRHSVATNMLGQNVSLPIISAVLGHQNTESTKVYISLDEQKLKKCALSIPPVTSHYYSGTL